MRCFSKYNSPIGNLYLVEEEGKLIRVTFNEIPADCKEKESNFFIECKKQLDEYFAGSRKEFDIPLKLYGTEFQIKVWKALEVIPYGEIKSYKDIAICIDNPKGCRAVGLANNRNPIPIIIPCHRVIGANGKLVGYGGGIDKKIFLLELEKNKK